MEAIGSYGLIISSSIIIILSFLFTQIAKRTNIPSVLMLIVLGILIKSAMGIFDIAQPHLFPMLEVLGKVGLIMIVLEAAIDLKLKKEKLPLILKSFGVALISLGISAYIIALIFHSFLDIDMFSSLLYSIPLSIMSSAIVIPSAESLSEEKKEFMIYESAFSDILGIMFFNFMIASIEYTTPGALTGYIAGSTLITLVISVAVSYLLIVAFQRLKSETKLFLFFAILTLLYAIGSVFKLSSLILILFFGIILKNPNIFFVGRIKKFHDGTSLDLIYKNFKTLIMESSFVIRTFFFVIFGIFISLSSLLDIKVIFISILILISIYAFRFGLLRLFSGKKILPEALIAPRGLITILLYFAIPDQFPENELVPGILLFIIIFTSIIMAIALIKFAKEEPTEQVTEPAEDIVAKNNFENTETTIESAESPGKGTNPLDLNKENFEKE